MEANVSSIHALRSPAQRVSAAVLAKAMKIRGGANAGGMPQRERSAQRALSAGLAPSRAPCGAVLWAGRRGPVQTELLYVKTGERHGDLAECGVTGQAPDEEAAI